MSDQIGEYESKLIDYLSKNELIQADLDAVGYIFGLVLSEVYRTIEIDTGMRGWVVDDMTVETFDAAGNRYALQGSLHWLHGGAGITSYQIDIDKNTNPFLYSYKLKNNQDKQRVYIGKTVDKWIVK